MIKYKIIESIFFSTIEILSVLKLSKKNMWVMNDKILKSKNIYFTVFYFIRNEGLKRSSWYFKIHPRKQDLLYICREIKRYEDISPTCTFLISWIILWSDSFTFFFIRGYVMSQIGVNKSWTIADLKMQFRQVICEINRDVCGRVIINFNERISVCSQNSGGGHILNMIFRH